MTHATHGYQPGDFVTETLVSDTKTWEVIAVTAKTITIRPTLWGEVLRSENIDGNPWPVVWREVLPHFIDKPHPLVRTLRQRKDGTFRVASWAKPLRPAKYIDGKPVERRDYRD